MGRKVKPKGRLKQEAACPMSSGRSTCGNPSTLLFLFSLIVVNCALASSSRSNDSTISEQARSSPIIWPRQYHVNLPKVGLISGLSIDPRGPGASSPSAPAAASERDRQGVQAVVGFLGIPYAAPPVGPLRFMPPGALQQQQQQQQSNKQQPLSVQLMPSGQRASVRPFNRLGSRCIHLADWLNHSNSSNNQSRGNDHNHQDNNQEQFLLPSKVQSEDCLNLNVFVPIRAANESSQQQQQQSIGFKSEQDQPASGGYDHSQFGHQGLASPNRTTTTTTATTAGQVGSIQSWPLVDPRASKSPVLVVIHTTRSEHEPPPLPSSSMAHSGQLRAQQLDDQAKIALRTESIVIAFNYRAGLLGFLPYADDEEAAAGNRAKGRRQQPAARYNHAIWDQIGLLHWVRRNVHLFGGDPGNITLAAADNRASLHLQLLCMSPLAKGLFKRAILLQRRRDCSNNSNEPSSQQVDLNQLIGVAGNNGIQLRRRLSSSLAEIVSYLNLTGSSQGTLDSSRTSPNDVYEIILSADIRQLAQIDHELRLRSSRKVLLLINEPTLDDTLLFPHLGPLIDHLRGQVGASSGAGLLRSLKSELNYCSYIRRVYLTQNSTTHLLEDPLQLIPTSLVGMKPTTNDSTATGGGGGGGWHRDPAQRQPVGRRLSVKNQQGGSSRSMAVHYFSHLNYLSSLQSILASGATGGQHRLSTKLSTNDDQMDATVTGNEGDDEHVIGKRHSQVARKQERRQTDGLHSIESINHLASLLSSVDIMFGYISCGGQAAASAHNDKNHHQPEVQNSSYSRLIESLLNVTDKRSIYDDNLIAWLKWIDFHSILSAGVPTASSMINTAAAAATSQLLPSQHCDFSSQISSAPFGAAADQNATTRLKNSFIFILNAQNGLTEDGSLLLRTIENAGDKIEFGLRNFLKFGDANHDGDNNNIAQHGQHWPNYDTLRREFEPVQVGGEEDGSLKDLIRVHLDLVPYLNEELPSLMEPTTTTTADQFYNNRSADFDNPKNPLHSLHSCLSDLDSSLLDRVVNVNSSAKCLTSSLAKFRGLTRRYAGQDLEPLTSRMNKSQRNNQMWEFGPEKSSATSLITTRNLVNQFSDMEDALSESQVSGNLPESGGADHHSHVVKNGTISSGRQMAGSGMTQHNRSLLKKFLGFTFKDTVGKALAIVVVTGLVIFLVNLIIVLVMTLRSSRQRRRASPTNDPSTNKVYDSGSSLEGTAAAKSILQQAANRNQTNDQSLASNNSPPNSSDLMDNSNSTGPPHATVRLTSSLRKASSSATDTNGFGCDAKNMRPQATRTKQLKFNLANNVDEDEDEDDDNDEEEDPTSRDEHLQHVSVSFDEQHHHHHEMIELSQLMSAGGGSSKLMLDASPLLAGQYLIEQPDDPYPHNKHSNDCAIHHSRLNLNETDHHERNHHRHHHHHHGPHQPTIELSVVQSPYNQSLTTASNTTSSTFRQTSFASSRKTDPRQFDGNSGNLVCSSHSPNSSTTLSMTPNQQTTDSSILNLSSYHQQLEQQQFTAVLADPMTYQQYYHHQHLHSRHPTSDGPLEAERSQFELDSDLISTLKRQDKLQTMGANSGQMMVNNNNNHQSYQNHQHG